MHDSPGTKIILKRLFKGVSPKGGIVTAEGVLEHLQGNERPYFSIVTDSGCDHKSILTALGNVPGVKLLVNLHLSDDDGTPTHAVANAAYFIKDGKPETVMEHLRISHVELIELLKIWEEQKAKRNKDIVREKICLIQTRTLAPSQRIAKEKERIDTSEADLPYRAALAAVEIFMKQIDLPGRWKKEAEEAKRVLEQPAYVDPEIAEIKGMDPKETLLIEIDGEVLTVEDVSHDEIECGPAHNYVIFKDSRMAGIAAKAHWKDMAENDKKEFACMVGDETLKSWALGDPAGPGSTKVRSLKEWLDLWLDTPEDEFASYDGEENDVKLSAALADALGIKRKKADKWVPAVAYRR